MYMCAGAAATEGLGGVLVVGRCAILHVAIYDCGGMEICLSCS